MATRPTQGLPFTQPVSPPKPTKLQSVRLFLSVWKENILLSAVFGILIFSPSMANWWENWRLYKLRRDVRDMNQTSDLYSRVPGWVANEDLLQFNRENDPVILRKMQARQERLAKQSDESR